MEAKDRVRDFILEKKIGEGGVGEVWLAYHQALKKYYAIKVIFSHLSTEPHFHDRFIQEAITMVNLEHPHIVGAHDFFSMEGRSFLVMSYIDGGSLQDQLKAQGPLPLNDTLQISKNILDALNFAHSRGVIHRDVKPSNILLKSDGHPYLVDFGISIVMGKPRITQFGTNIGTPEFMSPEQIKAKAIDHRCDVYSYGCVMYEMLTGRPPFGSREEGKGDYEIMSGHLEQTPDPIRKFNPNVDEHIEAVVMRAMAKDPADRYHGCSAMAEALTAEVKTAAPPENGNDQRLKKLEKTQKVLLGVAAVLLLSTIIGVIGWFRGGAESNSDAIAENTKLRKSIVLLDKTLEKNQTALKQLRQRYKEAEAELQNCQNTR